MSNHTTIGGATTLLSSPPLKRLQENLHDLITICLEAYTKTHGHSFSLTKLHYVSDEKLDGRFSMHFAALARDRDHVVGIPLLLEFTVKVGEPPC